MNKHWTRRAILQTGAAGVARLLAAQQPRKSLPGSVRVGILGLEGHYSEVLEAAKVVPEIQVVAVTAATPREARKADANRVLAAAHRYDDYRRMLDSEKLDVVAICDANNQRAASVRACAERGIPIAAEKPLAISVEELDSVKRVVAQHKAPLTMLLPMRFEPHYFAMHNIIASGDIGEVIAMGAQKSYKLGLQRDQRPEWMRRRETYGGTIPYIGVHMVDLMRWVSGREFVEAAAFQSQVGFPQLQEMENNTAIIYRLDNRGTANLRMDYLRPETAPTHGDDRLRVAGTKGVIEYQGGVLTLITAAEIPHTVTGLPPHRSLFADFLDSIYNHKQHLISTSDVYRVTEIVLRTRDAAESNRIARL